MITCKNLKKSYLVGGENLEILKGIDLSISQGEFVAIMGPSGSGKSTLMNILGLLDVPTNGEFHINSVTPSSLTDDEMATIRSRTVGFVFQQFNLLARTSAFDNVQLPSLYTGTHRQSIRRAQDLLNAVGLGDRMDHPPSQLSGGQQQRVAIARAMMNDPGIILADEPTGNLDGKSQTEIMALFSGLNATGKTVILITHEADVAAYARRIITIRDGLIVSDVPNFRSSKGNDSTQALPSPLQMATSGTPWIDRVRSNLSQARRSLVANALRTFLSMLGILIGVASLIAMLALGAGARRDIETRLASLGSNLLVLSSGSPRQGAVTLDAGAVARLTPQDATLIQSQLSGVRRTSATVSGRVRVKHGNRNANTTAQGVMASYEQMRAMEPTVGHFFSDAEQRSRSRVALIGMTVAKSLFGDSHTGELTESPLGQTMLVDRTVFTVIGLLPEKGSTGWRDQDDLIVIPLSTAMYRVLGKDHVDSIEIEVTHREQMESTQTAIDQFIRKRHKVSEDQEDAFRIRNLSEIQDTLTQTSNTMSFLLASIAVISLIVGGIGVMNIMLVSVVERTREIGLRKALGATQSTILEQFLIESICISTIGGVLGIFLGVALTAILGASAGWTIVHTPAAILGALVFSVVSGICFGYWPARKAAALNPIDSLRYE